MRWLAALSVAVLALSARAEDWAAQEYTMDAGDLDTPTTRWLGDKYARGPLAVLVFQSEHIHEQDCRQPMELKRAFGFDVEYVHAPYGGDLKPDDEQARKLLDARKWDVIVFWGTESWHNDYGRCSDDVKFRILTQVSEGAGLLFTNTPPPEVCRKDRKVEAPVSALLGGIGLTGRSARDAAYWGRWQSKKPPASEQELRARFFSAWRVGQGLVLGFPASPNPGIAVKQDGQWTWSEALWPTLENRTDHEYMLAEVARAILVAAGKAPEVEFAEEPPALWKLELGKTKGAAAKWALNVLGGKRNLSVSWRLRALTGSVLDAGKQDFPQASGKIECPVTLPALAAGRYCLDLFVDSARGRETFGYTGIEVPAPFAVTIATEKPAVEPGAAIKGTVSVAPGSAGVPPAGQPDAVVVTLVDSEWRTVERKELKPALGEKAAFEFATDPEYPVRMYVQADALSGGWRAGTASAAVNLLQRRHGKFNVVLWGDVWGPYSHWAKRKLWRTGVTSSMGNAPEEANLSRTPFIAAWGQWQGELNGKKFVFDQGATQPKPDPLTGVPTMQPCCWNDAPNFEKMLAFQDKHWQAGLESPVFVYNMYDEGPHSGCCLAPTCLAAYREWLKEQYGGKLEALNEEWQSQYKAWDEVNVLEPNDVYETKARDKGNFPRWSDRKHFAEANFCRTILRGQLRRARAVDAQARVGFEGSGEFGMDFDELLSPENTGFWCPYDGLTTEMVRSLKPPGYIHAFWIGYSKDADSLTGAAWRMVIKGAPSIWWWMLKGRGEFHGWLAPNNMPYPENQKLLDDCVLPLRRGLGDLLIHLDMPHDGIALYYAPAAAHAGELGDSAAFNSVTGAHENFIRLIEDCGFQWVYTTKKRVLAGDLEKRGIRLLVLPFHQALGQDEAETLAKFAAAGGTVLADLRPGVYSGHCRALEHGPAEKLFGIERTGKGKALKIEGQASVKFKEATVPIALRNNRCDAEIKAAGAVAGGSLDGQPVFLTNTLGKGQAVLLNFHVTQYIGEREMKKGQAQREFFQAFTSALGL
ncbi:MAG: beta-galactosidase, partial [Planctomycetota bacterium]